MPRLSQLTPLTKAEVAGVYKQFPEIKEPFYKGRNFMRKDKEDKNVLHLQINLPNKTSYYVISNFKSGEEIWYKM